MWVGILAHPFLPVGPWAGCLVSSNSTFTLSEMKDIRTISNASCEMSARSSHQIPSMADVQEGCREYSLLAQYLLVFKELCLMRTYHGGERNLAEIAFHYLPPKVETQNQKDKSLNHS